MAYSASSDKAIKTWATLPPVCLLGEQGMEGSWWDSGPDPLKGQGWGDCRPGLCSAAGDLQGVTTIFPSFSLGICKMVGVDAMSPTPAPTLSVCV